VLFVVEENWRGDRAWAAYVREAEARGERLDLAALQPPPVRDEENFFKAPKLALVLYKSPAPERAALFASTRFHQYPRLPSLNGEIAQPNVFASLRDELQKSGFLGRDFEGSAASGVLEGLGPLRPLLDEVCTAARQRPKAALPVSAAPLTEQLIDAASVFHLSQVMGVRAAAELELRQNSDAFADVFAIQRIAVGLTERPQTLVSQLMGGSIARKAAFLIEQGVKRAAWSEAQVAELQQQLSNVKPLASFRDAMRVERAHVIIVIETKPDFGASGLKWPWWLFHGWLQQNKIVYSRMLDEMVLAPATRDPDRIFPETLVRASQARPPRPGLRAPFDWIAWLVWPNVENMQISAGQTADELKLAAVACAIARYRMEHGRDPDSLDTLVPHFLRAVPRGTFDGEPMRYRSAGAGDARLYFLGQNGRDDNGAEDDPRLMLPQT
jgi:hypothetical protein